MGYELKRSNEIYETRPTDIVGTYYVMVCNQCGMPVAKGYMENHDRFHAQYDEMYEEFNELKDKVWRAGLE